MSRSGVRQAMGRNGPRILSGACGFRSNVSSWLGPPNSIRNTTDFALGTSTSALASAANTSGSDRPKRPAPAIRRSSRRGTPLQACRGWPVMESMAPNSRGPVGNRHRKIRDNVRPGELCRRDGPGGRECRGAFPFIRPAGTFSPRSSFAVFSRANVGEKDRDSSFPVGERVLEGAHS